MRHALALTFQGPTTSATMAKKAVHACNFFIGSEDIYPPSQ